MNDAHYWALLGLIFLIAGAVVWLFRRRDLARHRLRKRKLLHRERMAAMEQGVPLPELPDDPAEHGSDHWQRIAWLRRISLAFGLVSVFTGVGMCVGFYFAPDPGFNSMWTLGFIPALGGIGFILYWVVSRIDDGDAVA